jgi:hypothetical protein
MRPPIGVTGRLGTESSHGMTPVETLHLATFLASVDPDTDTDGPRHFRTSLPEVVAAMLSLRVTCPWCKAAPGQPCTLPGGATPLRRTLAHPARIISACPILTQHPRGAQHVR